MAQLKFCVLLVFLKKARQWSHLLQRRNFNGKMYPEKLKKFNFYLIIPTVEFERTLGSRRKWRERKKTEAKNFLNILFHGHWNPFLKLGIFATAQKPWGSEATDTRVGQKFQHKLNFLLILNFEILPRAGNILITGAPLLVENFENYENFHNFEWDFTS